MKIINNLFGDSLLKNSIYLMATNFIASIFAFFFWIIAARYYTPDDIGIGSAIFSSISLIAMIGTIGLPSSLVFYLTRDKNTDKMISSCLTAGIISSIIFSLIYISGLKFWTPELMSVLNNYTNILIFIFVTTSLVISSLMTAILVAGKKASYIMTKETVFHFIKMFHLKLFAGYGAMGILISMSVGLMISIPLGFILLYKVWKYLPRISLDPIIYNMASYSAGNYVAFIFYSIPVLTLPIIILNMISAKAAGYFYIAIMIANFLYGISQSISNSLFAESSDTDKFLNNINKSIKFSMLILIPGVLILGIFGKLILSIFNPAYAENAYGTMLILIIASIPGSLISMYNTVRYSQRRVTSVIVMNMMIAIMTIIISIPLIGIMNIEGAAVSYLIANLIGASVVISRIKDPKQFTLRLLSDIKDNVLSINS